MRLILDMNLSPHWCDFLITAGFAAEHWSHVGSSTTSDREIMSYAKRENLVVLTHDLDFGAILAVTPREKRSVVQIRADDLRPEVIGERVVAALHQLAEELACGALVTIEPSRTPLPILPL